MRPRSGLVAVLVVAALALGCGAPRLSGHARAIVVRDDPSAFGPDECPEDGEAGAVAAAVRAHFDASGGEYGVGAPPVELFNQVLSCHVATMDGAVRLSPDAPAERFARSCWARGGPADAQCTAFGDDRGPREPLAPPPPPGTHDFERSWFLWMDGLEDAEVVIVTIGTLGQADRVVVAHRDGGWRVVSDDLAWTN